MFKKLLNKKLLKNQKGLTLVELLAVVVILAIVAAIAIPAIGNIIENSRYTAVKADAINVINAANLYYTDTPDSTATSVTAATLREKGFLKSTGKLPDTASVAKDDLKLSTIVTKVFPYNIEFNGTTLDAINKDTKKGSDIKSAYIVGTETK
ncbi:MULTISPECIES: prepilin-type N-terminal cleavage/methylation domain-containing protein [Lysinibacillus]|uniref:prepilin-type N-terminal cleavage/methylation domain-containing protein n=1 Tax=Lysinibacillus TaxID=400634 RepID=UPI00258050A7|nr:MULTISPECIES: prepilin-type N-terminal cleavage/methylation domain-containing protein [Lysinibacillus]